MIRISMLLAIAAGVLLAGCSAGGRFGAINRTAKELEAADTDTEREDFGKLVDEFAAALTAEKTAPLSPADQPIIAKYDESLAIWRDSLALWDAKIGIPSLVEDAGQHADDPIKGGDAASVAGEYQRRAGFVKVLLSGGVPLQSFSNPAESKLAGLAKRCDIPIHVESGWSYISADSYRTLWPKAAAKIAEAVALENKN